MSNTKPSPSSQCYVSLAARGGIDHHRIGTWVCKSPGNRQDSSAVAVQAVNRAELKDAAVGGARDISHRNRDEVVPVQGVLRDMVAALTVMEG